MKNLENILKDTHCFELFIVRKCKIRKLIFKKLSLYFNECKS